MRISRHPVPAEHRSRAAVASDAPAIPLRDERPLAVIARAADLIQRSEAGADPSKALWSIVNELHTTHGDEIEDIFAQQRARAAGVEHESFAYADLSEMELAGFSKLYAKIHSAEPEVARALHANAKRFSPVAQSFLEHKMSQLTEGDAAREHILTAIKLTDIPVYLARYHYDAAKLDETNAVTHLQAARAATDNAALKSLIDVRIGKLNRAQTVAAQTIPARPLPLHGKFAADPWAILFAGRPHAERRERTA